ncbi:hypothetical protein IP91_00643 [Pseudoduganella lurida]|uniref:Uncharacterized protein n=1 Tax=Pseudoduganella lurida TaxID=1036180 RepID=A0A562RL05_9BURK|nr:hypothetical protein [Pseudoduganella lurida]TWI69573.1 hypothetical protein IP91_00643 [Pseudoduganella lurida]
MDPRREPSLAAPEVDAVIAAACTDGAAPSDSTVILFGADGTARRPGTFGTRAGARRATMKGETAWWFHGGPHSVALVPFAAAPEIGLQLDFVIDSADPRLARQRFDLFLFSEIAVNASSLTLAGFTRRAETALRAALEGGMLDLPPCTSLDEWNAFRGGFNELLYTRFGITVDDCVPVTLDEVDYAAVLRARAVAPPAPHAIDAPLEKTDAVADQGANEVAYKVADAVADAVADSVTLPAAMLPVSDAGALRRLFLELPAASAALRALPATHFATRQSHLQRLALAALDVNTMPSLALAAPGRPRAAHEQRRLAASSTRAAVALDELWAVLAQWKEAGATDDEVDRVLANLEFHLKARRGGEAP